MKKLIIGILAIALVSVTSFFVALGVMGGSFAGSCLSADAAMLSGKDNQSKIYNYWIRNGFSPAQAAGITANLKSESGYSPFRQEEAASWPRGGYGIAQFTGGQRKAVTEHMATNLGSDFTTYYKPSFGGAVKAEDGFVPSGVSEEVNNKFLYAQLDYLSQYMDSFKPSSIKIRTSRFSAHTGLTVPKDATLKSYLQSLDSAGNTAKAWTFLYEYPANINAASDARAVTAETLLSQFTAQGTESSESAEAVSFSSGDCAGGTIVAPINKEGTLSVTSGFGMRTRNSGLVANHVGIDIIGADKIQAIMDGEVLIARSFGMKGWSVRIDHGNGLVSQYGHMVANSLQVSEGQTVKAGQILGTMGATGDADGVHLHFQLYMDDVLINPWPFLTERGIQLEWTSYAKVRNEKPGPLPDP